ncbi:MAG: hypothetical protein H6651_00045 [Ardenticatenales bacterium]|nr:hypothetical protein [Ardenticatenales bacterium]
MTNNTVELPDGSERDGGQAATVWPYQAWLLRTWREAPDGPWRASLTHVQTRQTQRFNNLQALFVFLFEQLTP